MTTPYPVTEAFRADCRRLKSFPAREMGASFGRMLKEYEHGTASIDDLFPGMTVEGAAAVLFDALLHADGEQDGAAKGYLAARGGGR